LSANRTGTIDNQPLLIFYPYPSYGNCRSGPTPIPKLPP
jgi:hypothetical protein